MERHSASRGRQWKDVERFFLRFIPKRDETFASTHTSDEKALRMELQRPETFIGCSFGQMIAQIFSALPFEPQRQWFLHVAERVGRLMQAAGHERLEIRAEGERAHSAKMDR